METFEIQVSIEGREETLMIIPDQISDKFAVYDRGAEIGTVWMDKSDDGTIWCAEGLIARELLDQIGPKIEADLI